MKKTTMGPAALPRDAHEMQQGIRGTATGGVDTHASGDITEDHSDHDRDDTATQNSCSLSTDGEEAPPPRTPSRGLAADISTTQLKQSIWIRALLTANRFRVIRTIDIAVCCFHERPYKAALTAAQRAMRGMVKAELLRRYRTDRFQTVYGLTQKGVDWLDEAGHDASSSVRRVSDMTNPEHRLWAQFWVLSCEARGMQAQTEQEFLQLLNKGIKPGGTLVQGLLKVTTKRGKRAGTIQLRPDATCLENDGTTVLEADLSKRGNDREASLAAEVSAIGRVLNDGTVFRRVVILCKTERIRKRAVAVLEGLVEANNHEVLIAGRRHFLASEPGTYAVWAALESKLSDGRTELVDTLVGHVIIQLLPIWLPKVRIDASNTHSLAGWFGENYLPYKRPTSMQAWTAGKSPLLHPPAAPPI